jgi:pyruvate dehydrogenase E2 component (dihydrolipoamide acetyltransferase)
VGEWKKKVGEEVNPGDSLVEIETDKAQMDFECQEEGFLARVFVQAGAKEVPVNQVIGILAENKGDVEAFAGMKLSDVEGDSASGAEPAAPAAAPAAPSAAPAPTPASTTSTPSNERIFASPMAKTVAGQQGVNLATVPGSGPNGRILKADVLEHKPAATTTMTTPVVAPKATTPTATPAYTDLPVSAMRKVIADRLSQSTTTIPHFFLTVEVNVDKVLQLRGALNAQGSTGSGAPFKLSINDFVIKAAAAALRDVPAVNSSWLGNGGIRQYADADIAVAVATPAGLITPIVRDVNALGLAGISTSLKGLAERARSNKLTPAEYQGGTFTISNLGMYGIDHFTAIINPPHAGILAVGGVSEKVVASAEAEHGFAVAKVMNVTLSSDHRVVDGAVGAQWLQRFKAYLESPLTLML